MTNQAPRTLPPRVKEVIDRALVAHVATVTRDGRPVTWPMNPYLSPDGSTIDVSTGVTYPAKAERAKRNPRVGLLAGGRAAPLVVIKAVATVHDEDLQRNTDRYVRESKTKTGDAWRGQPKWLIRAQAWYWVRIFIDLTPVEVHWWGSGSLDGDGETWNRADGEALAADTASPSMRSAPWQRDPGDWGSRASYVVGRFGPPTLTVMAPDGFPVPLPCRRAALAPGGFSLDLPDSVPVLAAGSACVGFDRMYGGTTFTGQENAVFTGTFDAATSRFTVGRLLPDFSLPARGWPKYRNFLNARRRLSRRLESECTRRGQAVPVIRLP